MTRVSLSRTVPDGGTAVEQILHIRSNKNAGANRGLADVTIHQTQDQISPGSSTDSDRFPRQATSRYQNVGNHHNLHGNNLRQSEDLISSGSSYESVGSHHAQGRHRASVPKKHVHLRSSYENVENVVSTQSKKTTYASKNEDAYSKPKATIKHYGMWLLLFGQLQVEWLRFRIATLPIKSCKLTITVP